MGTGTFAAPTFEALLRAFPGQVVGLVTQPERPAGQKRGSTRQAGPGLASTAAAYGLPVLAPPSINAPTAVEDLRELQPDLLVVAAYGQILSPQVLAVPTFGAINVHASLLPKYRGAAPVAHAILQGERETGVTIIRMTPQLDAGEILSQRAVPILPTDTAGSLEARLAELGAELAVEVVRQYEAGSPPPGTPQDPTQVTKAPKIRKEFGLIDWSQSPEYLERFVRAMQPWPTAYTFLHVSGKPPLRLILTRIMPAPQPQQPGRPPGTVLSVQGDGGAEPPHIAVQTGTSHPAWIVELQPAGKRRMDVAEFLRGHPLSPGAFFGPELPASASPPSPAAS